MSTATVAPWLFSQFLDNDGMPLAGGKLYSFEAGLSSLQSTYTTSTLTPGTEFSNPIILDASGRVPGPIYLLVSPAYKFRLDDADDVNLFTWDNIIASAPSA
jgi:hypothetical protein